MLLVQLTGWVKARLCLSSAPRWSGSTCPGPPHCAPASDSSCLQHSEAECISRDPTPVQSAHAAFARASGNPRHRPQFLGGHPMSPPGTPLFCSCRLHHPDLQPQETGAKPNHERAASFVPLLFSGIACKQNHEPWGQFVPY